MYSFILTVIAPSKGKKGKTIVKPNQNRYNNKSDLTAEKKKRMQRDRDVIRSYKIPVFRPSSEDSHTLDMPPGFPYLEQMQSNRSSPHCFASEFPFDREELLHSSPPSEENILHHSPRNSATSTSHEHSWFGGNLISHQEPIESTSQASTPTRKRYRESTTSSFFEDPPARRRSRVPTDVIPFLNPVPVMDFFDAYSFDENNFERDPFAAQHIFATNSGLHIFDRVSELFGTTNTIDSEDPKVQECIDQLVKDVNDNLSIEDLGQMSADFNKTFDLKAPLFGCASCGVREFQMGLDKTKRFRDRNLLDLNKFRKTKQQLEHLETVPRRIRPIFSWYRGCDSKIYNFHPECVDSRTNEDGVIEELVKLCPVCSNCADKPGQPFSRYSIANGVDYGVASRLHWLKPLTLTEQHSISFTRPYGCIAKLSGYSADSQSAKKGHFIFFRQPLAPQQIANAARRAARTTRPVLPDVSDIEKYIGITFVGADETWKSLIPNRFRNIDDLKIRPQCVYDWLEVLQAVNPHYSNIFIDRSEETIDEMNGVMEKFILNAEVLSQEMEINIDKCATERPANQPVAEDEEENVPDTTPTTDDGPSTENEQSNNTAEVTPLVMHASFLTERDPHRENDKNQAKTNVLLGLKETLTRNSVPLHVGAQQLEEENLLVLRNDDGLELATIDDPLFECTAPLSPVPPVPQENDEHFIAEEFDATADDLLLNFLASHQQQNINPLEDPDFEPIDFDNTYPCAHPAPSQDAQQSRNIDDPATIFPPELQPILLEEDDDLVNEDTQQEPANVRISAVKDPSNEYESNDYILYTAFPCLFPLGSGLRKSGPLTKTDTRHMFTQFSAIFGKTHRFIFSLFDQMQRHHTAGNIASAVRNRPESLEAFKTWVNEPTFLPALERAAKNPDSKEAKKILNRIMPHVKTFTSAVPFSAAQRKKAMRFLYAMVGHMGMPSFLFTFAPDDTYGSLNIRLSMPQQDNIKFPANDDGLIEALQGDQSVFQTINIKRPNLKALVAADPVATAEVYRLMMHAVYKVCLGMDPEDKSRRSQPLSKKKRGMIGKIHGAFGVNESQARGSLHMHLLIWGGLPPSLLQYGGSIKAVRLHLN